MIKYLKITDISLVTDTISIYRKETISKVPIPIYRYRRYIDDIFDILSDPPLLCFEPQFTSLANRHSCSTWAETRDRKCFSMQLILVVGKMDMINQIC